MVSNKRQYRTSYSSSIVIIILLSFLIGTRESWIPSIHLPTDTMPGYCVQILTITVTMPEEPLVETVFFIYCMSRKDSCPRKIAAGGI